MSTPAHQHQIPVREDWLATTREEVLEPGQPIIDPHHHLWDQPGWRYLLDELLADLRSGHDVRATVYIQSSRSMLRAEGPAAMRAVGETEFANGVAAMCASGQYGKVQACAGIVGAADLRLGDAVRPVLEAHLRAGGDRFRGIRHIATWDPDPAMLNPAYQPAEDMLDSPGFRAGFAHLAELGLSYDAWLYFHQIPRLVALARAFPQVPIVLDHCGGILGIGRYAGKRDEVFAAWSANMQELAGCPNVMVKLGGLGMRLPGFGFEARDRAPSSLELAEAWRPWMERCIETFGAARCMFESNFPVDKGGYAYAVGWNAMKRIAASASAEEKTDLFWRSAARFYRLPGLA
ncbi:amidohydrolase family protein [Siccirubricoccus sp. KC 17139]|uniref:Amidohydrolase family protein n=1 Tax=Siccirubricoccus soli TaxID=2899147 RepID=A0ABT1D7S1_9PROT|nr:amidohydrolase family protein [Siccirubricoccus soli]MCO6417984.1 amidohydrolase family protein [Siccirubricoccus soli]MCP2684119.1 amidohydrolase family protein [Siccirubricoccus soli]